MLDALIRRRPVRLLVLTVLALVMAGLFAAVLGQSWTANADDGAAVEAERRGVTYLRPLVRLVGTLSDAQSAAVAGRPVDTAAVRSAVDAVELADRAHGGPLWAGQRWAELQGQIDAVRVAPASGQAAYRAFADMLGLAVELVRRVGEESNLILDREPDAYYLMDAALLRLPQLIISAGRAADLATLAGGRGPTGEDAIRVALARHTVAQGAADIGTGLGKSIDSSHREELGTNLAGPLDALHWAVNSFVPLVIIGSLAEPVDVGALASAGARVRVAALALGDALMSELDALLADRQAELTGERRLLRGALAGELVAALLALWLVLQGRAGVRRPAPEGDADAGQTPEPPEYAEEPGSGELVDARELLDFDELVHVGRAVRPRRREIADDHAG